MTLDPRHISTQTCDEARRRLIDEKVKKQAARGEKRKQTIDDGKDTKKEKKNARVRDFHEGDKVQARWKGGIISYPGVIRKDHGDGTFAIDYDDGDKATNVPEDHLHKMDKKCVTPGQT